MMKKRDKKDASPQATPFFARFLEGTGARTGATTTSMTLKYPSDRGEIDRAVAPLSQPDDNSPRTLGLTPPPGF